MQLPEPVHKNIANEFRLVANSVAKAQDLETQLYYFSALFGEVSRAMNYSWSPVLPLLHLVLQGLYQQVNARLAARNSEQPIQLIPNLPGLLERFTGDLADLFEATEVDTEKLFDILARMAELGYTTTGNGYYLYLKGIIKI